MVINDEAKKKKSKKLEANMLETNKKPQNK